MIKGRRYYTHQQGRNGNSGFNCWSATLFILGVEESLRWVWGHEMQEFLDKNTVEVSEDELQMGDILVMHQYGFIKHTALYVQPNVFFHKRGTNSSESTTLEGVCKTYRNMTITYRRVKHE